MNEIANFIYGNVPSPYDVNNEPYDEDKYN